jgi:hypothetical protein
VATDGFYFIFVRRVGEGWAIDEPDPVNAASTEHFLRLLFSLSTGAALVPENLVEDFGPGTLRAHRAVKALYRSLETCDHPLVVKLFEQWREFYSEATDYEEWAEQIESKKEFRSFVAGMGLDPRKCEAPRVFYALHTYYALLVKLVASLAAAEFTQKTIRPLKEMASMTGEKLRGAFRGLEEGGLFREYGIRNFLEGDFFGWYLSAWNDDIEGALSILVQRLADYDPGTLELAPENARDLLKKLYHYLLPREIRHDLGEYYTPDWLAERLIIQTLGTADIGNPKKRVLDPACGSGTFLVIHIKHIRERAAKKGLDPKETLDLILKNVIGFDLNPLAVIAARTNYLLALGDLLQHRTGDIDIPIYQADSVMTPSRGEGLFEGDTYPLKTSVGVFRIPVGFANRERMDALATTLDESVTSGLGEKAFLSHLAKAADLDADELKAVGDRLKELFNQVKTLHDEGLNGVWARIIMNQFAPLFIEPCDYIVGNPPWVNWESLPSDYRQSTIPLWQHYGLFPHGGMDTILGKGKKDISMLMTYVAADKYLKRGGRLGFVLSQSLFKTSGAGQGFRRFLLPGSSPIGPFIVEDFVKVKPFEGATNRTAVGIFVKGFPPKYPVTYSYWMPRPGATSNVGFDTPYEAVVKEKIQRKDWLAEPVVKSDPTSAWITARPKALKALREVLGPSDYEAHAGSFTGGANGVFWVEITGLRPGNLAIVSNITEGARRKVESTQAAIELDVLYPLLRGRDVSRWSAIPSASIIMTQDPKTRCGIELEKMQSEYPKTYAYMRKYEEVLRLRAAYRRYFNENDPYWSMFNVSQYTFAPWKVVWREQASEFTAAVTGPLDGRAVIPDHKLMMVETRSMAEAYYLCAVLNASSVRLAVASYAVNIQMDTHILQNIAIPTFSSRDEIHRELAKAAKAAHEAVVRDDVNALGQIEEKIDLLVGMIWELSEQEIKDIRLSLEEQ